MWLIYIYRKCIFSNDGENENGLVFLKNRVEKWTVNLVQWKLDLADTDFAENLDLKDTLQKIWATIFYL